jgi:hypothetical protein
METPYQPSEGSYGYGEQQIEENRYRVTFSGNPSTPRDTVQNYLLYRAAELTVQKGFDHFTVVERDVERSTRYYTQGYADDLYYDRIGSRRGIRRFYRPSFYSANAYPVNEYSSFAVIVLAEDDKPEDNANAYDALDVLQRLQPLIRRDDVGEEADDGGQSGSQ